MSYISKYLESLMTKKDAICDSQTTNSKYYTIGKAKIGLSDHFSEASKITCDVRIVNPLNAKTVYLVQVKEGPQILTFNLAGVKTFISNYLYIKEIKSLNKEVKRNISNNKSTKKATKTSSVKYTCNHNDRTEWTAFWTEVCKNVRGYSKVMNPKKRMEVYSKFGGQSVEVITEKLNEAIKAGILYKGSSAADLKTYWEND